MTVYQQHGGDSIEEIYKETSDAYGADVINITRQFAVFKDLRDVKQRYYQ